MCSASALWLLSITGLRQSPGDQLGLEMECHLPGGVRSLWQRDKLGRPQRPGSHLRLRRLGKACLEEVQRQDHQVDLGRQRAGSRVGRTGSKALHHMEVVAEGISRREARDIEGSALKHLSRKHRSEGEVRCPFPEPDGERQLDASRKEWFTHPDRIDSLLRALDQATSNVAIDIIGTLGALSQRYDCLDPRIHSAFLRTFASAEDSVRLAIAQAIQICVCRSTVGRGGLPNKPRRPRHLDQGNRGGGFGRESHRASDIARRGRFPDSPRIHSHGNCGL